MKNDALSFALAYLRLGYSVIPLAPHSKIPPKGFEVIPFRSRLATPTEIKAWLQRWPDAGLAVICGAISGDLLVLDVDPRHGGQESLEAAGLMPATPLCLTGGGGSHYWLRGKAPCGNIAPGLDIKAEGGYVAVPPTIHPDTGNAYKWFPDLSPRKVERAEGPAWLIELLGKWRESTTQSRSPDWVVQALQGAENGLRDNTCIKLAGHFRNLLPYDVTLALLEMWAGKCHPDPFPLDQVKKVVDSAYKYPDKAQVKGVTIVP